MTLCFLNIPDISDPYNFMLVHRHYSSKDIWCSNYYVTSPRLWTTIVAFVMILSDIANLICHISLKTSKYLYFTLCFSFLFSISLSISLSLLLPFSLPISFFSSPFRSFSSYSFSLSLTFSLSLCSSLILYISVCFSLCLSHLISRLL